MLTLLPGSQISSQQYLPSHTACMWHFHGRLSQCKDRASLIRFSWHLFCCLQISRADQVTMLFSDLNKDSFLQTPALVSNPFSCKLEECCFMVWATLSLADHQLGNLYPIAISLVLGNIPEWGWCLMILKIPSNFWFLWILKSNGHGIKHSSSMLSTKWAFSKYF